MTYTFLLTLTAGLYLLSGIIQLIKRRRYGKDASSRSNWTLRNLPRIAVIASLIVFERIVYRHAYSLALGLELTLLKVALSYLLLLILGRITFYVPPSLIAERKWLSCFFSTNGGSFGDFNCSFRRYSGFTTSICHWSIHQFLAHYDNHTHRLNSSRCYSFFIPFSTLSRKNPTIDNIDVDIDPNILDHGWYNE
jgi:hypothetical protein